MQPPNSDPTLDELFGFQRGRPKNKAGHMGNVSVVTIKAAHHRIAQLCATGASNIEVGALCGYTPQYISNLRTGNPAFQELVEHYTRAQEAEMLELRAKQARLGEMAVDELTDRMAENPDQFENRELLEIVEVNANKPRIAELQHGFTQAGLPPSPITIQFVTANHEKAGPLIEGSKNE